MTVAARRFYWRTWRGFDIDVIHYQLPMSEQDISTGSTRAIYRVFISYSHDSIEHARRVLELAERLRQDGVDAQLDQYVAGTPTEGWPRWMLDRLDWADFILSVCTETYYRRFRGHEKAGQGKGVDFEGNLITLVIYHAKSRTERFVPVLFEPEDERFIPEPVSGHTHYLLNSEDNYAKLYAFLTGQAGVVPRKLGPLKTLATEPVEPLTFGGPVEETAPAAKLDRLPGYVRQKTSSDALGDSESASAGETPSLTTKDNRLSDPDPPILEVIPYKETPTVDKLLDRIWNSLKSPPKVPDPHTYGREWILYDPKGEYFHKIGTRWAQFIENKQVDERPLREVGIIRGMTLEVRPPKQRILIINQRPLIGGGEEPLLLEYSDLRTVGGLLNRIQSSIPDLSVASYGTKWILYDPASGRYFDDIVKGDSRVLRAAGIATEDGDTFLDVRAPAGQVEKANVWQRWMGLRTELKVPIIAGLFAIVVAIVTGAFNLGVAIYNGFKASPTPTQILSATPAASPSSTPTATPSPTPTAPAQEKSTAPVAQAQLAEYQAQLKDPDLKTRTAGIRKLEDFAKDNERYGDDVVKVLADFVKMNAPWRQEARKDPVAEDVQNALSVIGRIHRAGAPTVNLENVDIYWADLRGAHLEEVWLWGSNLKRVILSGAHLEEANLGGVDFTEASLEGAHLEGALLWWSDVMEPKRGCIFMQTRLSGAYLKGAHLEGADLSGAIGLTIEQLRSAVTNELTLKPAYLTQGQ
jgi:hypothetical protein